MTLCQRPESRDCRDAPKICSVVSSLSLSLFFIIDHHLTINPPLEMNLEPSSISNAILVVDNKIASLTSQAAHVQTELMAAKQERNNLAPVYRLPNELIARILHFLQIPESTGYGPDDSGHTIIHDFAYNVEWEAAVQSCSRFFSIALATPRLWTHVDLVWPSDQIERYQSRANALGLTTCIGTTAPSDSRGQKMDVWLASTCLASAHAADISQRYVEPEDLELTLDSIKSQYTLLPLSILHFTFDYEDTYQQMFDLLERSPKLVELYISEGMLKHPLDFQLPLLTRLHLINVLTNPGCEDIIEFLQHSPLLTELVFRTESHRYHDQRDAPIEGSKPTQRSLILKHLRVLVLEPGSDDIMRSFLCALSLDTQSLQDVSLDVLKLGCLAPLIEDIDALWKTFSELPLPPACLQCHAYDTISNLYLRLHSSCDVTPRVHMDIYYQEAEYNVLAQELERGHSGLKVDIDTIQISGIQYRSQHARRSLPSWTDWLEERMRDSAPRLKRLVFLECTDGVHGLEAWIRKQGSEGRVFETVRFIDCEHYDREVTLTHYEALKASNLVQNVEWKT
jgi:hypothetical protein